MELVLGNLFIRPMVFEKAGEVVNGHEHNFDHVTYVAKGSLRIEKLDGGTVVATVTKKASERHNSVLIKAGVCHRLTALEDDSIGHCIYAHRTAQGDVVQDYDGWGPAYV
jgi:quercetin dioxygenase-like cupin family protein